MGAEGGSFLAAGAELQLLPGKPSLLSAAKPFPALPLSPLLLKFQLLHYWHHSLPLWSLHQTDVNPQCAGGSSAAARGAWSGEAEGGDRHRETFLHSSQLPLQGACSPSFSLSTQT